MKNTDDSPPPKYGKIPFHERSLMRRLQFTAQTRFPLLPRVLKNHNPNVSLFSPYNNSRIFCGINSGVLLYPIPKNATSYTKSLLVVAEGIVSPSQINNTRYPIHTLLEKISFPYMRSRISIPQKIFHTSFKFSCVRNPWHRLVSCYLDKINPPPKPELTWYRETYLAAYYPETNLKNMSFPDFVKFVHALPAWRMDPHFLPQHYFFNPRLMQFVVRVENLRQDMEYVISQFKPAAQQRVSDISLPRIKETDPYEYTEFYDDVSRHLVAKKYARDIEIFAYEFGK